MNLDAVMNKLITAYLLVYLVAEPRCLLILCGNIGRASGENDGPFISAEIF
jgi:hypothetical protein